MQTVLDVYDPIWAQIPKSDRTELVVWLDRAGPGREGLVRAVELLQEGRIAVTFYADEQGEPTLDVDAIAIVHGRDVAEIRREYSIAEPPPAVWP